MLAAFARLCLIISFIFTIGYINCLQPERALADAFSDSPHTISPPPTHTKPIHINNPVSLDLVVLALTNAIEVAGIIAAPILLSLGIKAMKHKRRKGFVLVLLSVTVLSLALFTTGTVNWILAGRGCSPNLFS